MLVSVVTAVRNGADTIGTCLASVAHQTVPAEHIVMDGQSTDGTLEILQATTTPHFQFVTGRDRGMYDAMGKGIARAQGDIVGILNADDLYADARVLERAAAAFTDPAVDTVYGDLVYIRSNSVGRGRPSASSRAERSDAPFQLPEEQVVRTWRAGPMAHNAFLWGWMPPHPTFFVRRALYEKHGMFRLDFGTAADYELMLRFLVKHRVTTRYIPEVLVKMRVGGASNATLANRWRANRFDRQAWRVNGLQPYPWTTFLKPARKLVQWLR